MHFAKLNDFVLGIFHNSAREERDCTIVQNVRWIWRGGALERSGGLEQKVD